MPTYCITYDLHEPNQNYEDLRNRLKDTLNGYRKVQQSVWVGNYSGSAGELRDELSLALDDDDKLLVVKMSGWATLNDSDTADWLKNNIRY